MNNNITENSLNNIDSILSKPNESDIKSKNLTEFYEEINNSSNILNDNSNYTIDRLKQMIEKEDSKSNMYSNLTNLNEKNDKNKEKKSKKDLFDNINKLLEENAIEDNKVLNNNLYFNKQTAINNNNNNLKENNSKINKN